jgi:crotonobetainyl-CoA:carnitine CoA-transferase CaiB-like acyl-CoA transferase
VEHQFDPPGSPAHAEVEAVFAVRTRAEWEAFGAEHDCCLEPVLDLDEALEAADVVELAQPGVKQPVRLLGAPFKLSRTPADPRGPGPALGEHTDEVLAEAGYSPDEIAALRAEGAAA